MITRDPSLIASERYDVVIIGGGILGVCHLFEASRRGLRAILIERDDFGGATSWASQRIIHGGLRYLQSLDFGRHRSSVRERTWLLKHFPDQVQPLACLMPLYNRGMKRRSTMRAALRLNDLLSRDRNNGLPHNQSIPNGQLLSAEDTAKLFPRVEQRGMNGGALWHDGMMVCPQRLLMEWLRWSCNCGALALNYMEAVSINATGGSVRAVRAVDRLGGSAYAIEASHVINTAGPWAGTLAEELTEARMRSIPLCLAFCLLLDRPAVSDAAVAVSPRQSGSPMYFLTPCQGRMLAGTAHLPWGDRTGTRSKDMATQVQPDASQVSMFLDELSASVPGLDVGPDDVVRIFAGLLPAARPGSAMPSTRTRWMNHATSGGPAGMITVTGIKYTTARTVAEKSLEMLFPDRLSTLPERPSPREGLDWSQPASLPNPLTIQAREVIQRLAEEEAVVMPDDLIHRRTDWGTVPQHVDRLRTEIASVLESSLSMTHSQAMGDRLGVKS